MLPGWPSRTSDTCEGSGDTDFACAGLWLQRAALTPRRALPIPSLLPRHHRAAASPEAWGVQAGRVPCAPTVTLNMWLLLACHSPALPWWFLGTTQPQPVPVKINPAMGSVLSTRSGFSAIRTAPKVLGQGRLGGCTVPSALWLVLQP